MLSSSAELRKDRRTLNAALMTRGISCIGGKSQDRTLCSVCTQYVHTSVWAIVCGPSIGNVLWIEWMPQHGCCALVQTDSLYLWIIKWTQYREKANCSLSRWTLPFKMHINVLWGIEIPQSPVPVGQTQPGDQPGTWKSGGFALWMLPSLQLQPSSPAPHQRKQRHYLMIERIFL